MRSGSVSRHMRRVALSGLVGLLVLGGAQAARAHRTPLVVDVLPDQATVSPDGRSISFLITTQCDRKWTVVEARVTATQAQGSGSGSFTPACNRITNVVGVTVPVVSGSFQTGSANVTARLVVSQGPSKQAQDSASLRVRPSVSIQLADRAVLQGDGAVRIDVTVTCPVSAVSQGGQVTIYDGQVAGSGTFGPTPCDTVPHTISVRVASSAGSFRVGTAQALGDVSVIEGGDPFPNSDLRMIQIVQA